MNPLSGFMPANTGSVSGLGDRSANIGKNVAGRSENDDAILFADDNARSFLAWVRNLADPSAGKAADSEFGIDNRENGLDVERPARDPWQALIADAIDQPQTDGNVAQTMIAQSIEEGPVPRLQGLIDADMADRGKRSLSNTPSHLASSDLPGVMVEQANTPVAGQTRTAANDSILMPSVNEVPSQANTSDADRVKANPPDAGQSQAARASLFQTGPAVATSQAAPANERPIKDHQQDWKMQANTGGEGPERATTPSLTRPAVAGIDDEQAHINRLTQERWPSDEGIAEKANRSATHPVQPIAGQAKDSKSIGLALADQKALSSEDEAANSRGQDKPSPAARAALANINEDDWQNRQSSDPVKGTAAEQTRPHPSMQDTAKGLAGDPLNLTAVKSTTGQTSALAQTSDPGAKTFQTTVMDQIVDKAALRSIHGRSEIQIRLKPEFLGQVQMNIAADKEQLLVRIITDQPMVKEIIETHLHQLRTELQNQGLTIDKFEVMVNPDADQQHSRDQFAQMFKQHTSHNGRRQPQGQDPETWHQDDGHHADTDQRDHDGVNYFA